MTKIAKFSNGHVDVYQGRRAVTVGWMLVTPEGNIISGHSIDRETALKTAAGSARYQCKAPMFDKPNRGGVNSANRIAYFERVAREAGFKSARAAYDDYAAKLAAFRATCKIEVVALSEGRRDTNVPSDYRSSPLARGPEPMLDR